MADQSRQQSFDHAFRSRIERFTNQLVTTLRIIVCTPVPPIMKVLAFQIEADWRDFPVYTFAMDDESPNEVYFEPPFKGEVLSKVGDLIPRGAINQNEYEDAGVATLESGARILAEWFGECWHAAGGAAFPIRAVISLHDSSQYFDLKLRRWIRDAEIWP